LATWSGTSRLGEGNGKFLQALGHRVQLADCSMYIHITNTRVDYWWQKTPGGTSSANDESLFLCTPKHPSEVLQHIVQLVRKAAVGESPNSPSAIMHERICILRSSAQLQVEAEQLPGLFLGITVVERCLG